MKSQDPSKHESKDIGDVKGVMDGRMDNPKAICKMGCYPQLNTS